MTILVSGASGQLGRRVLHHLTTTLGVASDEIVATTRDPDALADWRAQGVDVRRADFDDPTTLPQAFAGVTRLLLISTDAIDRPGKRAAQHQAAITAAKDAGVDHLVYTSMPKPVGSPLLIAPDHEATEAALSASRLPGWTVLRNNWYFENIFHEIARILATGRWYSAAGEGRVAHIARDDLGLAAAAALASESRETRTLTITGDRAYTTAEIGAILAHELRRPIDVVPVPTEGLVQGMVSSGLPEPMARVLASFDANTAAGGVADVTQDFRTLTGRDPLPYAAWAADNHDALLAAARGSAS